MALPWTAKWRDILTWLVIATLLFGFAILVYEFTAPAGASIKQVSARVDGFGVDANSTKLMVGGDPTLTVIFRLGDGQRLARSIPVDEASRCRVGQTVNVGLIHTHSGLHRVVVPADPCGS